jgi:hypothetical protein
MADLRLEERIVHQAPFTFLFLYGRIIVDPVDPNNVEPVESNDINVVEVEPIFSMEKVKHHLRENEELYIGLAVGLITGAAVGVMIRSRPIHVIAPMFNNAPTFNNVVNNGGHMRKIVRCIETGEMWRTVGEAAEAAGVSFPAMSRHINGHDDHIRNFHYVIEGLASG